jgi:hypothetical protein
VRHTNRFDDGEAQAGTSRRARPREIRAIKTLKDVRQSSRGDADTIIMNLQNRDIFRRRDGYFDHAPWVRVLDGVVEEIGDHLAQTNLIRLDEHVWRDIEN